MWPWLEGNGPDSEPAIDLDTMLDLTVAASVNGVRFEGVDLVLSELHIAMDSTKEDLERLADKLRARVRGGFFGCAPYGRPPPAARRRAVSRRRAGSCSATPPGEWAKSPVENTKRISDFEERLTAGGEIC